MKNSQFLDYYQHLQYQIMYQKLIDLQFASIGYCSIYDSPVFNMALTFINLKQSQLDVTEQELTKLDRKPCVYFENHKQFAQNINLLKSNGYEKDWEDSWMFHDGQGIDTSKFHKVKIVNDEKDLEEFLNTFDQCYRKDDPQNPYGELGGYINVARNSWKQHRGNNRIEYFTVFNDDEPVAVSTLTNFAGVGYISNVGSLPKVRGQGFGKTASLYCVFRSKENGNTEHALATEEGQYPNEFYKKIGFKTRFTALGYVKK